MAIVASAKSNVMKSVISAIEKCMLPSGRPGDSAASATCRSLSTIEVKYRSEDDSLIQDEKQNRRALEIHRGGWTNIFEADSYYPLKNLGFGLNLLSDNPFLVASHGAGDVIRGRLRKSWHAIEDKKALHLRVKSQV